MNECKPLPPGKPEGLVLHWGVVRGAGGAGGDWQGLAPAHFTAQLEDLRGHTAPVRAQLDHLRDTSTGNSINMGDKASLS